jgi:ferrous iron transport protein A
LKDQLNIIPLSALKPGEKGTIHSLQEDELAVKFMEMGCLPGEPVQVEQCAVFGDPISIKVSGYLLSLRLNEADKILVTKS